MSKSKCVLACVIAAFPLLGQGPEPQPSPTPQPEKKPVSVAWNDGKTSISGEGFLLRVSNRIQLRYTHESPDADVTLPGGSEPGADRGSFRVRRAKLKLDGWAYSKRLEYEVQVNWPALSGASPGAALEDAAINWDVTGDQVLMLRFGQFKVPFGQQELTSSGSQQFVDRALVSNAFARGRDAGLAAWGRLAGHRLEWRLGVFNGNGTTRTTNDNDAFQYDARVLIQPNGAVPLGQWGGGALHSESDFESKDKPLYAVALQFEHNDRSRTTAAVDPRETTWGASGVFKYRGMFATAESFWRDSEPETGPRDQARGWYVQAGVLLARRRVELAARHGRLDPSERPGGELTESGAVVAYVHRRHALKVQLDLRRLADEAGDDVRHELRLQTQLAF